ncbi:hypothetical protein [Bacillus sp. FJAT-45350]|uniref:hypothetical protein n=1 Tax=Bacillus sp. FJAT-45350 TaxID=2011014 RepID=UPI000BB79362|nr:hypothetical protein [Bacillus sp. FJAT-45350]
MYYLLLDSGESEKLHQEMNNLIKKMNSNVLSDKDIKEFHNTIYSFYEFLFVLNLLNPYGEYQNSIRLAAFTEAPFRFHFYGTDQVASHSMINDIRSLFHNNINQLYVSEELEQLKKYIENIDMQLYQFRNTFLSRDYLYREKTRESMEEFNHLFYNEIKHLHDAIDYD